MSHTSVDLRKGAGGFVGNRDLRRCCLSCPLPAAVGFGPLIMPNSGKTRVGTGHYNDTTLASHILLDSRNENLPKKRIHRNYAGTPGRETAPGFLLRGRGAAARGVFRSHPEKETSHAVSEG